VDSDSSDSKNFFSFASGPASNHFFGAVENIHNLLHKLFGPARTQTSEKSGRATIRRLISAGTTARDPIFWDSTAMSTGCGLSGNGCIPAPIPIDPTPTSWRRGPTA